MDEEELILGVVIAITLVIMSIFGSLLYYHVVQLEHQTERLSTLEGMDRCLYICGDINRQLTEQRMACFEKCEDNYVGLETSKLIQNG